jgi:hypothetical protein
MFSQNISLCSLFALFICLPLSAKTLNANGKYVEVKLSQKLYVNKVSENTSIPIHVSKQADIEGDLNFHFGNSGFAKIEYFKGDFAKRQLTGFWGNPVVKMFDATVFDDKGRPHACKFSKEEKKIKNFRGQQNVHVIDISDNLAEAVLMNTLNPGVTLESKFVGVNTEKTFYCHFI